MKKFKTQKLISTGNYSKIILAKYNNVNCVIKKYYEKNTKEFERERLVLKQISHENIINTVFIGRSRMIAFGLIGNTLRQYITDKKLPEDLVILFSLQIAEALKYLHSKKIIHFDLKPENIIIAENTIKLIDFGSAKFENEEIKSNDTTTKYTSLEYLIGLKTAHYFKDIWSFGCIFYEMMQYSTLFDNDNTFSLISEILDVFGSPDKESMNNLEIKHLDFVKIYGRKSTKFNLFFCSFDQDTIFLFNEVFSMNPFERITAENLVLKLKKLFQLKIV